MIIKKDILHPGSYLTGSGIATFSPERIVRIFHTGKALIRDGFRSQIPYEHHDESVPVEARLSIDQAEANKLKNNTGFVKDWHLVPNEDGQPVLWASLDVKDAKAAEQLGNTILFVSPQINDVWTSGKGQKYYDAPIHVALTNKPVHQDQQPFAPSPVPAGTFRLSCSTRQGVGITPAKRTKVKAGETSMRNFRKTMFSLAPDDLGAGGGAPAPTPDDLNGAGPDITSIAASLSVLTGEQFAQVLASLPEDKQAEFKMACGGVDPAPTPEPNPNGTAMSLAQLTKENDPRNDRIAKLESDSRCREVDDLLSSGRIKPVRAQQLKAALTNQKTRLSLCLDNYGELSEAIREIELRKTLTAGCEFEVGEQNKTKLSLPPRPREARLDDKTKIEDQKKLGEEMAGMA